MLFPARPVRTPEQDVDADQQQQHAADDRHRPPSWLPVVLTEQVDRALGLRRLCRPDSTGRWPCPTIVDAIGAVLGSQLLLEAEHHGLTGCARRSWASDSSASNCCCDACVMNQPRVKRYFEIGPASCG